MSTAAVVRAARAYIDNLDEATAITKAMRADRCSRPVPCWKRQAGSTIVGACAACARNIDRKAQRTRVRRLRGYLSRKLREALNEAERQALRSGSRARSRSAHAPAMLECQTCSSAGGAERPVFHAPPACSPFSDPMSEIRAFEYRCRRCAAVFRWAMGSSRLVDQGLVAVLIEGFFESGFTVTEKDRHACADGGIGVADLIGASPKEAGPMSLRLPPESLRMLKDRTFRTRLDASTPDAERYADGLPYDEARRLLDPEA